MKPALILCRFGIHYWAKKATARPGTVVWRCKRCNKVAVKHAKKARPPA